MDGTPLLGSEEAIKHIEIEKGFRCSECGEPLGAGTEFAKFEAVLMEGRPTVRGVSVCICHRPSCVTAKLEALEWCTWHRPTSWNIKPAKKSSLILRDPGV